MENEPWYKKCIRCKYLMFGICMADVTIKQFAENGSICPLWEEKTMEIKPCPSCGSDSKLRVGGPILGKRYVVCNNCGAYGPNGDNEDEAIKRWNAAPREEDVEIKKCHKWEEKESKSTPLTPSNSRGLNTADEIAAKTDLRANVAQLMEEAAELVTACSKYLRTCGIGQPTPVTVDEALAMIGEEAADVHLVTDVIIRQSEAVDDIFAETANRKILRWKGRLENDRQR